MKTLIRQTPTTKDFWDETGKHVQADIHNVVQMHDGKVHVEQRPFSVQYHWCDPSKNVVAYQTVSGISYHTAKDGLISQGS